MRSLYYFLFIFLIFFCRLFVRFFLLAHSLCLAIMLYFFALIYFYYFFLTCCFATPHRPTSSTHSSYSSSSLRSVVGFACLKCHALFKGKLSVVLFTNIVFLSFAYLSAAAVHPRTPLPDAPLVVAQPKDKLGCPPESRHCGIR